MAELKEKKLIVLLDMDMVLTNFDGGLLKLYKELYPGEPVINWDDRRGIFMRDNFAAIREDLGEKVRRLVEVKGLILNLEPIEGAIEGIKELARMKNVDVFIVSNPIIEGERYSLKEKYDWIEKHLGPKWQKKLILTKDRTVVMGDILVDDNPDVYGSVANPTWEHVLFAAQHNREAELNGRWRMESWKEINKLKILIESMK